MLTHFIMQKALHGHTSLYMFPLVDTFYLTPAVTPNSPVIAVHYINLQCYIHE